MANNLAGGRGEREEHYLLFFYNLFKIVSQLVTYDWLVPLESRQAQAGWRSITTGPGAQFVMITGINEKEMLSVDSSDLAMQ